MAKAKFEKLFSEDEANELIPRLEHLVRELQLSAGALRARVAKLVGDDADLSGKSLAQLVDRFPELRGGASRLAEVAGEIESLGVFLKDIDQGLIDFPYDAGGEVVFLCWQFGEPHVVAWHTLDGGFSGRKPLPGVTKPYLN